MILIHLKLEKKQKKTCHKLLNLMSFQTLKTTVYLRSTNVDILLIIYLIYFCPSIDSPQNYHFIALKS